MGEEAPTRPSGPARTRRGAAHELSEEAASASCQQREQGEHPGRPRVAEGEPRRRGDHAERCRREHGRSEPPGPRVRPRCRASCGCSRPPPKLNAGASATRRAVVAVTGGGCFTCGASGYTMLDTTGFETGAISWTAVTRVGSG